MYARLTEGLVHSQQQLDISHAQVERAIALLIRIRAALGVDAGSASGLFTAGVASRNSPRVMCQASPIISPSMS
jgi:hypothetical protein